MDLETESIARFREGVDHRTRAHSKTSERRRIVGWFHANRECEISDTVKTAFSCFERGRMRGRWEKRSFKQRGAC